MARVSATTEKANSAWDMQWCLLDPQTFLTDIPLSPGHGREIDLSRRGNALPRHCQF